MILVKADESQHDPAQLLRTRDHHETRVRSIVAVNPFRACMWSLHDRNEEHVNEQTCKAEIASFARHGQLVPALGRVLHGDPGYDIELIYGARRLFVARHLNVPLLVEMREICDRDALLAMDIENRQRTDISPYERAVSYERWLRTGHFGSQDDIARALKVSSSRVSRLLRLAKLPGVILNAFASPLEIREAWGLDIMNALDDPRRRSSVLQTARAMGASSPHLPAKQVYRELIIASARGRRPKPAAPVEIVRDRGGAPLFRIRQLNTAVSLVVPRQAVSAATLLEICALLAQILERGPKETSNRSASVHTLHRPRSERSPATGEELLTVSRAS